MTNISGRISNTLNASIANYDLLHGGAGRSPTAFNAGGFSFSQLTTNADFSRFFPAVANGMNVAFGAEYRRENYQIFAGELGSYNDADGVGFGHFAQVLGILDGGLDFGFEIVAHSRV